MARYLSLKNQLRRPEGWLRASTASALLLMAVPGWAYGTGVCTDSGVCSVYAYLENGDQYLLSDSQDIGAHANAAHVQVSNGNWQVWNIAGGGTLARPQTGSALAFSLSWGPGYGTPLAGDWTGDGFDGFSLAFEIEDPDQNPHTDDSYTLFAMANLSFDSQNVPSIQPMMMAYRIPKIGGTPMVGDWDGDGIDSFGVYKDGVYTLANNSAPLTTITIDLTSMLPADPVLAAQAQGLTWPWSGNGIDYIALGLPSEGKIRAVSGHYDGYVQGISQPMYVNTETLDPYEPGLRPVALPAPVPRKGDPALQYLVGAFIAPIDFCFDDDGIPGCDPPINPEDNGGAVRPGGVYDWEP